MTITIADAVYGILAKPSVPVILIDTCSFIDLFRRDATRFQPRVPVQEILAAADLVELMNASPDATHLLLPELIPREYSDHADNAEATFENWTLFHDQNQDWLAEASLSVALALPRPLPPVDHRSRPRCEWLFRWDARAGAAATRAGWERQRQPADPPRSMMGWSPRGPL